MNFWKVIVLLMVFNYTSGCELMATVSGIGTVLVALTYGYFFECCVQRWIDLDSEALRQDLATKLYGQHLVSSIIIKHITSHITRDPSKALALSFHGGPGTGKNYVSKIIAESIYRQGMRSKYVHLISATKEFQHRELTRVYKEKLKNLIEISVKECPLSLFIFDEIDKMPPGILDILSPYLDYHEHIGGVDYRNAIFIFLSNTGGDDIFNHSLTNAREKISLNEMEQIISNAALSARGSGYYANPVLLRHLITAYIPFLPLEKKHIKECIKDVLLRKKYYILREDIPEELVDKISKEMNYFPEETQLFSKTGCKRVSEKVDYAMDED